MPVAPRVPSSRSWRQGLEVPGPPSRDTQMLADQTSWGSIHLAATASGWLPAPPRRPVPTPCLPHAGQPARGAAQPAVPSTHSRHSLTGKDMEPTSPALPRDEGPPTPGSATKVPPVRGPGAGSLPRVSGKWLKEGRAGALPSLLFPCVCVGGQLNPGLQTQRAQDGALGWGGGPEPLRCG